MKNKRQDMILALIDRYDIETQDNLIERLQAAGFAATQATISRDIRELGLSKVMTGRGGYKYIRPPMGEGADHNHFNRALTQSIVRLDAAGNIVVIKTSPGMAGAVATGIDAVLGGEILGSVAGDDTIIVVVRDPDAAARTCDSLRSLMHAT